MPNSVLIKKKLALFSAMGNPECYCIPDLSVPKFYYCLFKTLQPENGTGEGGTVSIFKIGFYRQLSLFDCLIFALLGSSFC